MDKLTTSFSLYEFVHPEIYEHPAIRERCLDFIHSMMAPTAQAIKEMCSVHIGKEEIVTINDWFWGGKYVDSGLRLPYEELTLDDIKAARKIKNDSDALEYLMSKVRGAGARLSGHHFGVSMDLKLGSMTPGKVQDMILARKDDFPYITRMENAWKTGTWLHCDIGMRNSNDIKIFDPW